MTFNNTVSQLVRSIAPPWGKSIVAVLVLAGVVEIFFAAGCATSRSVQRADLVGVYYIQFSVDTRERMTLQNDGAAVYESIPVLGAGDSWIGRWELRGDTVILTIGAHGGAAVEIPLQVRRKHPGIELLCAPKSWSDASMVLPGVYRR